MRPSGVLGTVLLLRLCHGKVHLQPFLRATARPPLRDAAHGGGVACIPARAEADIARIRAAGIRRVEPDPAQPLDPELGPGMGGLVHGRARRRPEIARDIARRHPPQPRKRDQRLRVILANPLALRERLGRGRVRMRRARAIGDRARHRGRERMGKIEPRPRRGGGKRGKARIRARRGRLGQIGGGRDRLAVAPQHPGVVLGLDRALHMDVDALNRALDRPALDPVASPAGERPAPRAARDGDLPVDHALAVVARGHEAQRLHHEAHRAVVEIGGEVIDAEPHLASPLR